MNFSCALNLVLGVYVLFNVLESSVREDQSTCNEAPYEKKILLGILCPVIFSAFKLCNCSPFL